MKQGDMVIIDQNFAASAYVGVPLFDFDSTICAGYLNGSPAVGAGAGDSGGPLFVRKNGNPLLIGVVSGGGGNITTSEQPGIYTKLFTVKDWMNSIMNQSATISEFPEGSISVFFG
jgi:secreted trypsin-like serine protease